MTAPYSRGPVLITGAEGFLGRTLVEQLGADAVPLHHASLDITDEAAIAHALDAHRPYALINAAALADVDRCEQEPELAYRVNAVGPGLLARACAVRAVHLVHLSTDYVFDGIQNGRLRVDSPTGPVNHYGATKLEGETRALNACENTIVARVAWVFGLHGKGFGSTLPGRLARGERVDAIVDRYGHPTYVRDAARRIISLMSLAMPGVYHVVNEGPTSWYGFALRMAERLNLPEDRVQPVSRLSLAPKAPRPVHIALDEDPRRPGVEFPPLRPWQEAQDAFLLELLQASDASR